jgi:SAM-dependent methyltransferase
MSATCWTCAADAGPCRSLGSLPFAECERCGLVFRDDPAAGDVQAVYAEGDYAEERGSHYDSDEEEGDRRRDARVRLRWLARHAAGGRLLDVGAAGGAFVLEAGRAGYDAVGIEPTPAFAARARERVGVAVRETTIEDAALAPESLDVVTMWHVLEHVPHPRAQLERVAQAMRPGAVLALEVPNFGSAVAARTGPDWPSLQPEVHVSQFSPRSLRALLESAGLRPVEIGTTALTPYLPLRGRFAPRHVGARFKAAAWLRTLAPTHPSGHELLRAIAVRP